MEAQFEHMVVQSGTMEYASRVLTHYFSVDEPSVIECPAGVAECLAIKFTKKQFRALRDEGVLINEERLNQYFPMFYRDNLSSIPPSFNSSNDSTIRAFVDIEGFPNNPFEIAIIFTAGREVLETCHIFLNIPHITATERYAINHIHGCIQRSKTGLGKIEALYKIKCLLQRYEPAEIISNGMDVLAVLPDYHERVRDFSLPPWQWRPGHYSHMMSFLFKAGSIRQDGIPNCNPDNHMHYRGPYSLSLIHI